VPERVETYCIVVCRSCTAPKITQTDAFWCRASAEGWLLGVGDYYSCHAPAAGDAKKAASPHAPRNREFPAFFLSRGN
jgi:hypothetical protein